MLQQYIEDTQNLLNDSAGQFFTVPTLTSYINRARRRIASASGCVRILVQAHTHPDQEQYSFHEWTALVQATPGVREILAVRSLAVAIGEGDGAWKPMWNRLPWTDFNARFRIWNRSWVGTISYPGFYAQYGFGVSGSVYLAPIPSQEQPMELDCSCMPMPLATDSDPECIQQPWTDAVCYFAAFMALLQQQRAQDATAMLQLFQTDMPFCASVVAPTMVQAPYGATIRAV